MVLKTERIIYLFRQPNREIIPFPYKCTTERPICPHNPRIGALWQKSAERQGFLPVLIRIPAAFAQAVGKLKAIAPRSEQEDRQVSQSVTDYSGIGAKCRMPKNGAGSTPFLSLMEECV
jgi:hypothetical protein